MDEEERLDHESNVHVVVPRARFHEEVEEVGF